MSDKRIALVFGICGQDGSYLAELLLEKNYTIYGVMRRHSSYQGERIEHIKDKLNLIYGDVTDQGSVFNVFNILFTQEGRDFNRLEIYNLSAQSNVGISFSIPEYTGEVDALGTLRILEVIRTCGLKDKIRLYQASTSELFGKVVETPQSETTPFNPCSPYAIAKQYGYSIVKNYRESYNIFACNGILFNHTSPRRGEDFVCRKITMAIAAIHENKQDCLYLGNLNAKRDLGHAKDYVEGMWMILQQDKCDDFVLSMNETHSIRDIIQMSFDILEKKVIWEGEGLDEVGKVDEKVVVKVDPKFFRPSEVDLLLGDSTKARTVLKWNPKYTIREIIKEMVLHDVDNHCSKKRRTI